MPPRNEEQRPRSIHKTASFWLAFGLLSVIGLGSANVVDNEMHVHMVGGYSDGTPTLISIAGFLLAAIVAALARLSGRRAQMAGALICAMIAPVVIVLLIYSR